MGGCFGPVLYRSTSASSSSHSLTKSHDIVNPDAILPQCTVLAPPERTGPLCTARSCSHASYRLLPPNHSSDSASKGRVETSWSDANQPPTGSSPWCSLDQPLQAAKW